MIIVSWTGSLELTGGFLPSICLGEQIFETVTKGLETWGFLRGIWLRHKHSLLCNNRKIW
jgi:hypothetical protein